MIESLKLALSIFDNKDEVYYPSAELAVYGWLLIPVFIAVVTAGVLFASPTIAFPTYDWGIVEFITVTAALDPTIPVPKDPIIVLLLPLVMQKICLV